MYVNTNRFDSFHSHSAPAQHICANQTLLLTSAKYKNKAYVSFSCLQKQNAADLWVHLESFTLSGIVKAWEAESGVAA